MNKIKELIKELVAEGKSAKEIAESVAKLDEAKEMEAKDIVAEVQKELKAIEAAKAIEDGEEAEASEKKLKELAKDAAKEEVKDLLKELPALKVPEAKKEIKAFNHYTKKLEVNAGITEGHKALGEMLTFMNAKKWNEARAVLKEIEQQKEKDYKELGIKTALYSDATTGSYLIPTEVEAEIFQRAYQSKMLQILNTKTVTYNDKVYPVISEIDLAFITDESTQIGDKTPTIDNPSVSMARIGGMTYSSNALLQMKGANLVSAFVTGFGDAVARFVDEFSVAASVTGNSDGFNGLVFDANTDSSVTASTQANIAKEDFTSLKQALGAKFREGAVYIANTEIRDLYGNLVDDAGNPIFKGFVSNGTIRPYGKEFIENAYIPDTFDIATGKRTTGTDNVLICLNGEGVIVGFDQLRLESSEHFKFDYDQMAWRGVLRMGQKVISKAASQGACVAYKKITA